MYKGKEKFLSHGSIDKPPTLSDTHMFHPRSCNAVDMPLTFHLLERFLLETQNMHHWCKMGNEKGSPHRPCKSSHIATCTHLVRHDSARHIGHNSRQSFDSRSPWRTPRYTSRRCKHCSRRGRIRTACTQRMRYTTGHILWSKRHRCRGYSSTSDYSPKCPDMGTRSSPQRCIGRGSNDCIQDLVCSRSR